ncbi:MAG TPA: disulfide bond formation protein B [Allosphingosinicella sp.]|jgi:disulfide bond formation protein DsbB|nr:disulfide bond formation protein B [Allosphingosinicella sp.]
MSNLNLARALALLVPAALLAGAWSFQIWGGLYPCEMCWWQRYAHLVAAALALVAIAVCRRPGLDRSVLVLAALAILTSGMIGAYHAGVEAHVFKGITTCTQTVMNSGNVDELMAQIMAAPVVSCDQVQWRDPVLGISMAGWNAILSTGFALLILWLTVRRPRTTA